MLASSHLVKDLTGGIMIPTPGYHDVLPKPKVCPLGHASSLLLLFTREICLKSIFELSSISNGDKLAPTNRHKQEA